MIMESTKKGFMGRCKICDQRKVYSFYSTEKKDRCQRLLDLHENFKMFEEAHSEGKTVHIFNQIKKVKTELNGMCEEELVKSQVY